MGKRARVCVLLCLPAVVAPAAGAMVTRRWGSPPASAAVKGPRAPAPTGYAGPAGAAPKVDGTLDDACWGGAAAMSLARTLDGNRKADQATEVRAVRHGGTLYLAFRCVEPAPEKLRASRRGEDGAVWSDDSIEVFLGFGGAYWHFAVNAAGSTYDGRGKDGSWDSGFRAATGRAERAWTAELAIPLAKMTPKREPPKAWVANFNRNRHAGGAWQEFAWSPTFSGDSHQPGQFGKLIFAPPPKGEPKAPAAVRVRVTGVPNGVCSVAFDLSDLPKDPTVHRADLLVFRTARLTGADEAARKKIEIYHHFAERKDPRDMGDFGEPLKPRPPWFDRFDATAAVRAWLKAGRRHALTFFIKSCPLLNREAICLDVAWAGDPPGELPRQATGVKAVHRAGQTFITFREIEDDPAGTGTVTWGRLRRVLQNLDVRRRVRYVVYRAGRPITAASLHRAERIAVVRPLSGWNVNGRSLDKAIDALLGDPETIITGQWNPFARASMEGRYGTDCVMERLAVPTGAGREAKAAVLPRGTGLYVHTLGKGGKAGKAFYAVVTSVNGVENTGDITAANAPAAPVAETPGEGEPVLQKVFSPRPYFNYREKRLHYVRWVGPPQTNLPSAYYNWSVAVPDDHGPTMPMELSLHRDGRSYCRTQYRVERDSLVLTPHDFPVKTWWYGYHESLGTLKSFAEGVVHNYTERRLLSFIDWACRRWPVDRARILVTGCSGGAAGGGALHLGVRHPEVFNLVLSGYGEADYAGAIETLTKLKKAGTMPAQMERIWGKVGWAIKADTGRSVWEELNLARVVGALPAGTELPMISVTGHGILEPMRDFYVALLTGGHPFMCRYGVYGGGTLLPISRTGTWSRMVRLDVRRDRSLPAFRGPEAAKLFVAPREPSGNLVVSDGVKYWWASMNVGCRWKDVVDRPARYEVTLRWAGSSRVPNPAADVTLRRLAKFQVRPDRTYRYTLRSHAGDVLREGRVDPASGLLRFKALPLTAEGVRLIVTP